MYMCRIDMILCSWMVGFLFLAMAVTGEKIQIVSGAAWNDVDGKPIQAHGGCLLQLKDQWYWFGEDKEKGHLFNGISCYVSNNLLTWKRLPNVLISTPGTPLNANMVVERPRVLFNRATNKFVMYFHYDDSKYKLAQIGVATSNKIDSGWKFIRAFSPLNSQSRDLSLFQDDDGKAYVIFASDGNANLKLARLSDDYMDVKELVYIWNRVFWEATGLIKEAGVYHMIFSLQKGWSANPNKVVQARNLAGPWSKEVDIADPRLNTYSSQNTHDLTVTGTKARTHIFTADRWVEKDLGRSKYIWQPLIIRDGNFRMDWHDVWAIDVKTGVVTVPKGTNYIAPRAQAGQLKANKPSRGQPLRYDFLNPTLKFQKLSGTSPGGGPAEWCSIYYTSPGGTYRTGQMSVNGGRNFDVFYPPTSAEMSIPVRVNMKPGAGNSIDIVIPTGVQINHIIIY